MLKITYRRMKGLAAYTQFSTSETDPKKGSINVCMEGGESKNGGV